MKHKWVIFLLLAGFVLSGCGENGVYSGKLILGGQEEIATGESEQATIAVAEGDLKIADGGTLTGDIYQIAGSVKIEGTVNGNVSYYGGELKISPNARITGNILLGGSGAVIDPEAQIGGEVIESTSDIPSGKDVENLTGKSAAWQAAQYLVLILLAGLIGRFFPVPVQRASRAVSGYLIPSLAMGTLVSIVGVSLLIQMAFTILLIPVTILGFIIFGIAGLFGLSAVGAAISGWIAKKFHLQLSPVVLTGGGTGLLVIAFWLLKLISLGSEIFVIAVGLIGLGAVSLTRFGLKTFIPASQPDLE